LKEIINETVLRLKENYIIMRRKIYDKLLEWKNNSQGRTALLIEGARRVGKSYIVEQFARDNYKSYIVINFDESGKTAKDVFEDVTDIPLVLSKISSIFNTTLYERESLIVFDEVQKCPRAREVIKFLVKDGRYDYIETGSLISIRENVKQITIPSEEESISMYPMDFEEFCWALGNETAVQTIRGHFETMTPLSEPVHKKIMDLFRKYTLVGGMPQAVESYARSQDFSASEAEKRMILKLYRQDVSKRADKSNRLKTEALFDAIPSELGKHDKTFILSDVDKNAKYANYEDPIYWLDNSYICNICYNSSEPSIGLRMNMDRTRLKCYMGDTGLLVSHSIDDDKSEMHDIYAALLTDNLHLNEGMFIENVIAQILRSNGHKLFYHSFYENADNRNRYELDFLIRRNNKISPIEVKSGTNTSHRSLEIAMKKYSKHLGQPFILYTGDVKKKDGIAYLPLYMAICL